MGKNDKLLYEKAFKRFTSGILYIVVASYILGGLLFHLPHPINYFFLAGGVLFAMPIILIHNTPMVYIKKSIKIYLVVIVVPLYCITVMSLLKGVATSLFWYIVIPVYLYTTFPSGKTIKWVVGCLCLMLSAFLLTFILQSVIYDNILIDFHPMPLHDMLLTEIVTGFFSLLIICYCLYYIHYFHQLQIDQLKNSPKAENGVEDLLVIPENDEDDKYERIYAQVIEYIEIREPYLNPEFKITQMVNDLNINATYLAKAIRKNKNTNFSNLINYYRIERVKELIQTNTSKYTLEYIYMSSGFKSQSSFNRAFKQQMNITPSEYYREITS